jgi:hypothetical protein
MGEGDWQSKERKSASPSCFLLVLPEAEAEAAEAAAEAPEEACHQRAQFEDPDERRGAREW